MQTTERKEKNGKLDPQAEGLWVGDVLGTRVTWHILVHIVDSQNRTCCFGFMDPSQRHPAGKWRPAHDFEGSFQSQEKLMVFC
jgi:hypothetical protein